MPTDLIQNSNQKNSQSAEPQNVGARYRVLRGKNRCFRPITSGRNFSQNFKFAPQMKFLIENNFAFSRSFCHLSRNRFSHLHLIYLLFHQKFHFQSQPAFALMHSSPEITNTFTEVVGLLSPYYSLPPAFFFGLNLHHK